MSAPAQSLPACRFCSLLTLLSCCSWSNLNKPAEQVFATATNISAVAAQLGSPHSRRILGQPSHLCGLPLLEALEARRQAGSRRLHGLNNGNTVSTEVPVRATSRQPTQYSLHDLQITCLTLAISLCAITIVQAGVAGVWRLIKMPSALPQ